MINSIDKFKMCREFIIMINSCLRMYSYSKFKGGAHVDIFQACPVWIYKYTQSNITNNYAEFYKNISRLRPLHTLTFLIQYGLLAFTIKNKTRLHKLKSYFIAFSIFVPPCCFSTHNIRNVMLTALLCPAATQRPRKP